MKRTKKLVKRFKLHKKFKKKLVHYLPGALFVIVFAATGVYILTATHAASIGTLTATPSTNNPIALGSTFTVTITEDTGSNSTSCTTSPAENCTTAVQADLKFDPTKLQYVSGDDSTSGFPVKAALSGDNTAGTVTNARGSTTPLSGSNQVVIVTFKAIGLGATNISFASDSAIVSSVDYKNLLTSTFGPTLTITDQQAPTAPTGLTTTALSNPANADTQIRLSWNAATDNVGVTGYDVYRNGAKVGTTTTTTYIDTALKPKTAYSYYVVASDQAGNQSGHSATLSATTAADTNPPTAPTGLTATATNNSVDLKWAASSDDVGVIGYYVFRGSTKLNSTPIPQLTYTDSGLTAGDTYSYTVKATDAAGNVSAASTALAIATEKDTQPPSTVSGLTSPSRTDTSVTLLWNRATDNIGVTGYYIYRDGSQLGSNGSPTKAVSSSDTSATQSYIDSGLTPGTTHSYTVKATDAAGNKSSSASNTYTVKLGVKPGDVNLDDKVDLSDLTILSANFGKSNATRAMGDLGGPGGTTPDGVVNVYDLAILCSDWGK